jgi:hypothetical protein
MRPATLVARLVTSTASAVDSIAWFIPPPCSRNDGDQYQAQQALMQDPARRTLPATNKPR